MANVIYSIYDLYKGCVTNSGYAPFSFEKEEKMKKESQEATPSGSDYKESVLNPTL